MASAADCRCGSAEHDGLLLLHRSVSSRSPFPIFVRSLTLTLIFNRVSFLKEVVTTKSAMLTNRFYTTKGGC